MAGQEEKAIKSLCRLRRLPADNPALREEYLAYKAEVLFQQTYIETKYPGKSGPSLAAAQYVSLVSTWSNFRRLAVGCTIMLFQQFMGCNAIIYYAVSTLALLSIKKTNTIPNFISSPPSSPN
jgi:hypothetical protein